MINRKNIKKHKNLDYEDRLIIYIDILGFKNFVDYTSQTKINPTEKIKIINNLLIMIKKYFTAIPKSLISSKTRQYTAFSDLLVVSVNLKEIDNIICEIYDVYNLLRQAVLNGFLLRGSIVYGKLIHTKDVLFGPGLITAYNNEKTIAKYPRIIIDDVIVSDLKDIQEKNYDYLNYDNYISRDTDGLCYIDFFKILKDDVIDFGEYARFLLSICNILLKIIDNQPLKEKYLWLKGKFIAYINENVDVIGHSFTNENITKDDLETLKFLLQEHLEEFNHLFINSTDEKNILTNEDYRLESFKIISRKLTKL
jgi:hypothetical protein